MEINGTKLRVYIKLTPGYKDPNLLGIATLIVDEWFEVKGFRIRKTDFVTRNNNGLWITPPASPPHYTPLFSTTAPGKDKTIREEKRKQLWFQLEDLITQAYHEALSESPPATTEDDLDLDEIDRAISGKEY